jgi:Ca2+-binding EF-hand superfamily protein
LKQGLKLAPTDRVKDQLSRFGEGDEEQIKGFKDRLVLMKSSKNGKLTEEEDKKIEELLPEFPKENPRKHILDLDGPRRVHDLTPAGAIDLRIFLSFSSLKLCQTEKSEASALDHCISDLMINR